MKRLGYLAMLMMLASPAQAGESFSFVVAGHRIRIEAPRGCDSPSCVSVTIPGIYERRGWRDEADDDTTPSIEATPPPPSPPPVAQQPIAPSTAALASRIVSQLSAQPFAQPAIKPVSAAPPSVTARPALTAAPDIAPTPPPQPAPLAKLQALATPNRIPAETVAPAPPAPAVAREGDSEPGDTPLGDWHSIGKKGAVRIEACGTALCGYALNRFSNLSGEAVLINMKPVTASGEGETASAAEMPAKETSPSQAQQWSGSIYSRASGATYNATMAMSGPNTLRVEACAIGRYFCTSNIWSRIPARSDRLMSRR